MDFQCTSKILSPPPPTSCARPWHLLPRNFLLLKLLVLISFLFAPCLPDIIAAGWELAEGSADHPALRCGRLKLAQEPGILRPEHSTEMDTFFCYIIFVSKREHKMSENLGMLTVYLLIGGYQSIDQSSFLVFTL